MSVQITTAFVEQYKGNIELLTQQMGSKVRAYVDVESINGKAAFFDQVGATGARERPSRHTDTPRMDTPHSRRRVTTVSYDWADLIDNEDMVRTLNNPTNAYAQVAAAAMGRTMDAVILDAAIGTAYTGVAGGTSTALPSANVVAAASTGLTIAKLRSTAQIMDLGDADVDGRVFVYTTKQKHNLLATTEVTSADYNSVKALVHGEVDTFMGFKFVEVNGFRTDGTTRIVPVSSTTRRCVAFCKGGLKLALGMDIKGRITERPDKNYATQVFYSMDMGATRMQESKVVRVDCLET